MQSREWPRISVVVPVRNEERFIARTLQQLLGHDYPPDRMEILVGVAGSTDRTAEIVQEFASRDSRVRYFLNPHGLSSGARNLGVQLSCGEIIVFIDGHVYIDNNALLRNTALLLEEKGVSVLSRPQFLDPPDNTFFQNAVALARGSWLGHALDSTIYTREEKYVPPMSSGASYRREVFDQVGLFDTSFDACEDLEFNWRCHRAGYRSFTSMRLAVRYYPRDSVGALFRQMMRYGAGRHRLSRKHPHTLSIAWLVPSLTTIAVPSFALLSVYNPVVAMLLLPLPILYLCVLAYFSLAVAVRAGLRYLPLLPALYLAIHTGLGSGFLREMVFQFQKKR